MYDHIPEIVMSGDTFVLYDGDQPMLSPTGKVLEHNNARLLRQAINQIVAQYKSYASTFNLLSSLVDETFLEELTENDLQSDAVLIESRNTNTELYSDNLQRHPELLNFIWQNTSSLQSVLKKFTKEASIQESMINAYSEFLPETKVVCCALATAYELGYALPLLLSAGYISAWEFAAFVILLKMNAPDDLISERIQQEGIAVISESQRNIGCVAFDALDFLSLFENTHQLSVIEEIIHNGENDKAEFKSTLRWDLRNNKKSPAIEHASLKTICAFLNSDGGDLLIGVRDDGSIEGIESDRLANDDRFLLHIWNLIKTCMGLEVVECIQTTLQRFGDKTVCRVRCKKATKPTLLKQNGFNEAMYVRVGPSTSSLEISAALEYIKSHFS